LVEEEDDDDAGLVVVELDDDEDTDILAGITICYYNRYGIHG
jgi:hypothetical protein